LTAEPFPFFRIQDAAEVVHYTAVLISSVTKKYIFLQRLNGLPRTLFTTTPEDTMHIYPQPSALGNLGFVLDENKNLPYSVG